MGKLTLDLAGRLPALELITPGKPMRELISPGKPFDFHLKRAENTPTNQDVSLQRKTSSDSTTSLANAPTHKSNVNDSSAPKADTSTAIEAEAETSDADSPESHVTEIENEESAAVATEEQDSEDGDSEADEVTLTDKAIQVIQDPSQNVAVDPDSLVAESEEGELSETTAIDSEDTSDQSAKKRTQETASAKKSIEAAQDTSTNKLALENEAANPTIEDPQPTNTEATETNPEQGLSEKEEVYQAAKRPPLVATETETTEKKAGQQTSDESEVVLEETADEAKPVSRKLKSDTEEENSQEGSSREKSVSRKSKTETNKQVTRVQESTTGKATQAEAPPTGEIPSVPQVESESKSTELRSPTAPVATNSSNPAEVTSVSDAKPTSENNSAPRVASSIREASFGRAAKVQSQTSGTDTSANIDRAKFVQRVSRALHISHERGGEIRLRLSPPELGSLTVNIQLKDGVLTAQLEAETPAAQKLLLENVSVLKDRLAEQQVRVERFDVELAERSPQNPQDGQQHGSAEQRQARGPIRNGLPSESTDTEPTASPTEQTIRTDTGQLNVVI